MLKVTGIRKAFQGNEVLKGVDLEVRKGDVVTVLGPSGSGGMISFAVQDAAAAQRVLEGVRLIKFAESLGGTESLITYPIRQTHADLSPEECVEKGITDSLLRLSVGLESLDDLLADLAQACKNLTRCVMTAYDFDKVVDRRHSDSLKYDFAVLRGRLADVLPLWVADMDFPAAQAIAEALAAKCRHGIFGYSEAGDEYFAAVNGWYSKHFGWEVRREWLVKTPGVVFALAMAVKAYTNPGDAVLIQRPVYYPFSEVIESNGRRVVSSSLRLLKDGGYAMDFEDLESKIVAQKTKLLLLCSPHNPGASGRGRSYAVSEIFACAMG